MLYFPTPISTERNRTEQKRKMDPPTETTGDIEMKNRETMVGDQKPLHRFLNGEPKCLGIAVLLLGCGELLLGIPLATVGDSSALLYVPFWLGALFVISGNLSIYTEGHPSKKMVTVCLSMYVVTLLGIFVSMCSRLALHPRLYFSADEEKALTGQVLTAESVLLILSLCVCPVLIFLACRARAALKSTKTRVLIQQHLPSRE
ncbi:hypothetical protein COCON_G00119890 [Conger conger]|uniref:Uncharacterized protein n=1 Tax=Conger conger TaxID=82655 RepID=A0A9Q1HYN7_CONCO|nr:hypothetical protein COCON_G00119890 [Conger conger]